MTPASITLRTRIIKSGAEAGLPWPAIAKHVSDAEGRAITSGSLAAWAFAHGLVNPDARMGKRAAA